MYKSFVFIAVDESASNNAFVYFNIHHPKINVFLYLKLCFRTSYLPYKYALKEK